MFWNDAFFQVYVALLNLPNIDQKKANPDQTFLAVILFKD